MILNKLVLHNFGAYQGRHTLDLSPTSAKKPIILVGGLNGGGKTTLLDAVRLVLYGKRAHCSNRNSQAYDTFLEACVNHSAGVREGAALSLTFQHLSEGNLDEYTVHRSWSKKGKTLRETIEVLKNAHVDQVLTDSWDEMVEIFLPAGIADLFFFDGEKIERLADLENASEFLKTAVGAVLGLDVIDRLAADLQVIRRRKHLATREGKDRKKLEEAETDILQVEKRKMTLIKEKERVEKDVRDKSSIFESLEKEYRALGGVLYDKRNGLECEQTSLMNQLQTVNSQLLDLAAGHLPLCLVNSLLMGVKKQATRERDASNNAALSEIMRERDQSLLQVVKGAVKDKKVHDVVKKFFAKDLKARVKKMAAVEHYMNLTGETDENLEHLTRGELARVREEANALVGLFNSTAAARDDIDQMLGMVPDAESLASLIDRRTKAKIAHMEAESHRKALREEIDKLSGMIDQQSQRLDRLIDQDVDDEYETKDGQRSISCINRAQETLREYRMRVVERHVHRLQSYILESFRGLLTKKTLISDLRIHPDTLTLRLFGSSGQAIKPERLSAGERQLLAISMVWGLAKASGRPIPAIIDTPLGRLDSNHRKHLVERYFPYASHQIILLSTDEEIDSRYYNLMRKKIGRQYHLVFDDETHSTHVENGYFW